MKPLLASGDVLIGQIASGYRVILFAADSHKDFVMVFMLRKASVPSGNSP
jgi:hypothetical protein